jgi:hypothetical protein
MADERATVTLTLTDEMSDKVQALTQRWQELRRSIRETSDSPNYRRSSAKCDKPSQRRTPKAPLVRF